MIYRWFGVICILGACGFTGFSLAGASLFRVRVMEMLDRCLEVMHCQMEYRFTQLPELCDIVASACTGPVRDVFLEFGRELAVPGCGDSAVCMALATERVKDLPSECRSILNQLGAEIGKADLQGALSSVSFARTQVQRELDIQRQGQAGRVRSYRALGICGGAALAILLL